MSILILNPLSKPITFYDPGIYEIKVLGNVSPKLFEYFIGEIGQVKEDTGGQHTTTLIIHIRDQAELIGLINMLYNWRLDLLSVKMKGFTTDNAP